jgi:hypothetical protein
MRGVPKLGAPIRELEEIKNSHRLFALFQITKTKLGNLTPSPILPNMLSYPFELPPSSSSCFHFRPRCVNLPKSLRYYKLFSYLCSHRSKNYEKNTGNHKLCGNRGDGERARPKE